MKNMKLLKSLSTASALFFCTTVSAVDLNVLEWEGYVSSFEADFAVYAESKGADIKLNIIQPYITNPDDIFSAMRAKKADVVTPSNSHYKMNENKIIKTLQPIDFSKLTNYSKILPSLRAATYDESAGSKYSVPLLGGAYGIGTNNPAITGWADMWSSENKNKFSISTDCFECNIYSTMMVLGYGPDVFYGENGTSFDKEKVQSKLNELVANTDTFWGALGDASQLETLTLAASYGFSVAEVNAKGMDWKMISPAEGQTLWLDTLAIGKHVTGAKLEAAYLLIDFLISESNQKAMLELFGTVIVNGETAKLLDPEFAKDHFVGDESYFKADYLWRPLSSRVRGSYKAMWDKAMAAK
jgi:spermidine/putrescine transport system substrate-binding protein